MPVCKKCETRFPNYLIIDDKQRNLSSRKYCLSCSPFGLHNTRPIGERISDYKGDLVCLGCGKLYSYNKSKGHGREYCSSCVVNNRRFKVKKILVDYKGGKCEVCGYDKNIKALQFHHNNPSEKDFSISGKHCLSLNRLKEEVNKCSLLCANCHIEEHDRIIAASHNG